MASGVTRLPSYSEAGWPRPRKGNSETRLERFLAVLRVSRLLRASSEEKPTPACAACAACVSSMLWCCSAQPGHARLPACLA